MPSERVRVKMVSDTWDPIQLPNGEGDYGEDYTVNKEDLDRFMEAWHEFDVAHKELFKRAEPVVTRRHG